MSTPEPKPETLPKAPEREKDGAPAGMTYRRLKRDHKDYGLKGRIVLLPKTPKPEADLFAVPTATQIAIGTR